MEKRIIINNISKEFRIGYRKNLSALARFISLFSGREPRKKINVIKNVSFEIAKGEILGIMGGNGSGKSTLLRIIAGIYTKDFGSVVTNGKIISLINLIIGLKERLSMKDNIYLCCSFFGLSRREIKECFDQIVSFSGLSDFLNTKIYQFSEGMKQRLSFSIAINCKPDILLLDEVFEVGDEEFKKKSGEKIIEIAKNGGCVILVSHDEEMVKKYCSRVIIMEKGLIKKSGSAEQMVKEYVCNNNG